MTSIIFDFSYKTIWKVDVSELHGALYKGTLDQFAINIRQGATPIVVYVKLDPTPTDGSISL